MVLSRSVLVLDSDSLTQSMICEWLSDDGWRVLDSGAGARAEELSLIVLDLPHPRGAALGPLQAVSDTYPGVPVIVISPMVFSNVGCNSSCAQSLGVAGVLPKSASREVLVAAVRRYARAEPERAPGG
jgi:CheY-like chemotaxis protein